jgi:hypothetical protein
MRRDRSPHRSSGKRPLPQPVRRADHAGRGAESYYAARAKRDPAWREAQVAAAAKRERRRRERDPRPTARHASR